MAHAPQAGSVVGHFSRRDGSPGLLVLRALSGAESTAGGDRVLPGSSGGGSGESSASHFRPEEGGGTIRGYQAGHAGLDHLGAGSLPAEEVQRGNSGPEKRGGKVAFRFQALDPRPGGGRIRGAQGFCRGRGAIQGGCKGDQVSGREGAVPGGCCKGLYGRWEDRGRQGDLG